MRPLTTYDPFNEDSDDEEQEEQRLEDMIVDDRDIALLKVITKVVDERKEQDFDQIYHAFESYTKANGVNNRSQCLNILVNLCKYENDETWSERLEHCLHDYNLGEHAKQRDADLNQRLFYFQLVQKNRYLDFWREQLVQIEEYDQKLWNVAVSKDSRALVKEAFSQWSNKLDIYERLISKAERLDEKCLKKRFFSLLKHKTVDNKERTSKLQQIVYTKFFRKWESRFKQIEEQNQLANQMSQYNSQLSFIIDWTYQSLESRIERQYNSTITTGTFNTWRAKSNRMSELNNAAIERDKQVTSLEYLDIWRDHLDDILTDKKVADDMYEENLLSRVVYDWNREATVSKIAGPYLTTKNNAILTKTFESWLKKTQLNQEAARFRKFMLLYRVLKTWRLETGVRRVRRACDYDLVKRQFKLWLLKQRYELYQRYVNAQKMSNVLAIWYDKRLEFDDKMTSAENQIQELVCKNTMKKTFDKWANHTVEIEGLKQAGVEIYDKLLMRRLINKLYSLVADRNELHSKAVEIEYDNTTSNFFTKWKQQTSAKKQQRLEQLFNDFIEQKEQQVKLKMLDIWTNTLLDNANMSETALAINRQNSTNLIQNYLLTWVEKTRKIQRLNERAVAIDNDRLLSFTLTDWFAKHEQFKHLNNEADLFINLKTQRTQSRYFRAWNVRMFKINSMVRDADLLYERIQRDRFRLIFRTWVARAHDTTDTITANSNSNSEEIIQLQNRLPVETPSKVGLSSIDRWRQIRSTPRGPKLNSSSITNTGPSTPSRATTHGPSKLRHQLFNFNTPMN